MNYDPNHAVRPWPCDPQRYPLKGRMHGRVYCPFPRTHSTILAIAAEAGIGFTIAIMIVAMLFDIGVLLHIAFGNSVCG